MVLQPWLCSRDHCMCSHVCYSRDVAFQHSNGFHVCSCVMFICALLILCHDRD